MSPKKLADPPDRLPEESSAEQDPAIDTTDLHTSDGIYVLRTTQQNQVQLNILADQKANIIIGVSLIFFTLAQRQLVSAGANEQAYLLPLIMLAVTMLGSFMLAVLVLAPKMRRSHHSHPKDLPNPLFFGFFPSVQEDEFAAYLTQELRGVDRARELLIRDIYQTGRVLRRKYRLLRFAYLALASGVLISAAASTYVLFASA